VTKGRDGVAERDRVDLGPEAAQHPALDEPVEPGLGGAAGHAEPAGTFKDPDPRLGGEQPDQSDI